MSKTREDPIGSPIVKSVFQPKCKRKLCPVPIPAKDTSSDWSTVDQSTIGKVSVELLRQDWSEEDSEADGYDPGEESGMEVEDNSVVLFSPEQLREVLLPPRHSPIYGPPACVLQVVAGDHKIRLARSPAVESLSDLLGIKSGKARKLRLLPPSSASSSSSSYVDTSQVEDVLTSTMVTGPNPNLRKQIVVQNISVIKTRDSLDPRLSVQPSTTEEAETTPYGARLTRKRKGEDHLDASAASNLYCSPANFLSSTPARDVKSAYSPGFSSIHSSEAGGSMLVPRVIREMVTEERVEETEVEDDNWCLAVEKEPNKQSPGDNDSHEVAAGNQLVKKFQPEHCQTEPFYDDTLRTDITFIEQYLSQSPDKTSFKKQKSPDKTSSQQSQSPNGPSIQLSQSPYNSSPQQYQSPSNNLPEKYLSESTSLHQSQRPEDASFQQSQSPDHITPQKYQSQSPVSSSLIQSPDNVSHLLVQTSAGPSMHIHQDVQGTEEEVVTIEEQPPPPNVEDISIIIGREIAHLSPNKSANMSYSSSGARLSSDDTSGEIFSAVVHKTQVTMVVPYLSLPALCQGPRTRRKKFRLASTRRAQSKLRIFSPAEYYRDKPSSERMFDEFLEEEEDTDRVNDNDLFS